MRRLTPSISAWTRFEEAVRENPYLTAKEFCIKDMGCVDPFMKWARRTKHNITQLRQQALDERKKAERLNRYVSLSRRNSLFFGSHEGAKRGALFYSLSCSCRLCGIDFFEYLTDIINRVAAMGAKATADTCRNHLPDKWEKGQ